MLVLVSSTTRQAGVSTLAYALGYCYSNWINRPILLVSIEKDTFYKDKCKVNQEFNSKPISIVNGNARGVGELQVYCYKVNELLYYYQAQSNSSTESQHYTDLEIFLERASRSFGLVIVDMDSDVIGFERFLDTADVCFCVLPPDNTVLNDAADTITDFYDQHRARAGIEARTEMRYIINKHERDVSVSSLSRKLGVSATKMFTVPYMKELLKEGNHNHFTEYLNGILIDQKGIAEKTLEISLKRMYDFLRKW